MDSIDLETVRSDYEEYSNKLREIYDKIEPDSLDDILNGDDTQDLTSHEEKMAHFYQGALTVLAKYKEELEKSESAYH